MSDIDYLAIGHVTRDLTPAGPRLGGSVTYSALTARALGLRVALVTSMPRSLAPLAAPLDGVRIANLPTDVATTFENVYTPAGRQQILSARAAALTPDAVPEAWRSARVVHLAPVAGEVAAEFAAMPGGGCLCVTPQGWMRQWDEEGRVSFRHWEGADTVLAQAGAVVLSIEDVAGDEALAAYYARQARVAVVTRGAKGSTLYVAGQAQAIPAPPVREVDPTGAGDVFAASFFARLCATGDPLDAARFATLLASDSVTRAGLEGIPTPEAIERAEARLAAGYL